jgi:hypothetical protein
MVEENKEVKKEAPAEPKVAAPQSGSVPNPETAQQQQPGADLNVSDLNAVKSIIDIATQRGAFKANELEAVGKTYNKLVAFLEQVTKQQQEQTETQGK